MYRQQREIFVSNNRENKKKKEWGANGDDELMTMESSFKKREMIALRHEPSLSSIMSNRLFKFQSFLH